MGVGVDGCRSGWLACRVGQADAWELAVFESLDALWEVWSEGREPILVDVPIGLPDETSARACDTAARALLGSPRASSVFNPPTRAALNAGSWEDAAHRNEAACGKRISKQTWAIIPKIREVDAFIRADPTRQDRVREIHPEVVFQVLNGGVPLSYKKKSSLGREERIRILEVYAPEAGRRFDEFSRRFPRSEVQLDDILDAMSAAVVASRFSERLRSLPSSPPRDSVGLRCEMVLPLLQTVQVQDQKLVPLEVKADGRVVYSGQVSPAVIEQILGVVTGRDV